MLIVAGHLIVDPQDRQPYLTECAKVVEMARNAPGNLDFALTADLLDPARINIFERWESQQAVDDFRGSGPTDSQAAMIRSAQVAEYDIARVRSLT